MMLSIITIAFNNHIGLKKTLAVFESNGLPDSVELVIVDGGSSDGSKTYLEGQTLTNNWISEPDNGIYNAMNKGLERANGKYVWFLNSGDYIESMEILNSILNTLTKNPDAVYGETMMVDANGLSIGHRSVVSSRKLPNSLNWKSFRMGMNVGHQSFLVKRSLAVPYDESLKYVADIDWMIKCLKSCRVVVNMKSVIACFTLDGFSSANRKQSNVERYKVLKKHYGFLPNAIAHLLILFRKLTFWNKV